MKNFFSNDPLLMQKLVDRLKEMQNILLQSRFFSSHEVPRRRIFSKNLRELY